ncbi:hypothetical protein RFI_39196 [Reticulomyxa filosa]|uniref:RNA helicase n=1 Tax=Reticulomyxa filosa TaxID=46433 RepID=X6L9V5_RETFI|nr:hypothetical protein RFI_39196 [Reticulomyxa filosa]|eukprot:ETN98313.1 hypothetical protein RFI_39196 [Reticulomyxa filosa]
MLKFDLQRICSLKSNIRIFPYHVNNVFLHSFMCLSTQKGRMTSPRGTSSSTNSDDILSKLYTPKQIEEAAKELEQEKVSAVVDPITAKLHPITVRSRNSSVKALNVSIDPKKLKKKLRKQAKKVLLQRQRDYLRKVKLKAQLGYEPVSLPTRSRPSEPTDEEQEMRMEEMIMRDTQNDFDAFEESKERRSEELKQVREAMRKKKETTVDEEGVPFTFSELGVQLPLCKAIEENFGVSHPTQIQRLVIPHLLRQMKVIASDDSTADKKHHAKKSKEIEAVSMTVFGDQTGTGKTLAYLLPILEALKKDELVHQIPLRVSRPRCLILAPVRELCMQIRKVIHDSTQHSPVSSCMLVAGEPMSKQHEKLMSGVDIVVGTPERVYTHMQTYTDFRLTDCRYVVLDEGDVLFNEGFWEKHVKPVLQSARCVQSGSRSATSSDVKTRYLIVNSATITKKDKDNICNDIGIDSNKVPFLTGDNLHCVLPTMNLHFWNAKSAEKLQLLRQILRLEQIEFNAKLAKQYANLRDDSLLQFKLNKDSPRLPQQTIVFVRTKRAAAKIGFALEQFGYNHEVFFAFQSAQVRKQKFQRFLDGQVSILVATDAAMRGLDTTDVNHVILFDFPHNPRTFLQRIGRTGFIYYFVAVVTSFHFNIYIYMYIYMYVHTYMYPLHTLYSTIFFFKKKKKKGRVNTRNSSIVKNGIDQPLSKVSALVTDKDAFIAAVFLTALNEGKPIIELDAFVDRYRVFPHIKMRTSATSGINHRLVPFEHAAVRLLTEEEKEEMRKWKSQRGKMSATQIAKMKQQSELLSKPRLWWYSKINGTRVPFYGVKKKVVKRLLKVLKLPKKNFITHNFQNTKKKLFGLLKIRQLIFEINNELSNFSKLKINK